VQYVGFLLYEKQQQQNNRKLALYYQSLPGIPLYPKMLSVFQTLLNVAQDICIAVVHTSRRLVTSPFTKKKSLENEIILITGGGRGFGKTLAICLAQQGPKHAS